MITDNPDTNSRPSESPKGDKITTGGTMNPAKPAVYLESPSSRPMTLRQQLFDLYRQYLSDKDYNVIDDGRNYEQLFLDGLERFCQEIAREARLNMVDYFDQVPRNDLMDWKGLFADTRRLLEEEAELTQKPPQPKENT
jgi:hypothetical protein